MSNSCWYSSVVFQKCSWTWHTKSKDESEDLQIPHPDSSAATFRRRVGEHDNAWGHLWRRRRGTNHGRDASIPRDHGLQTKRGGEFRRARGSELPGTTRSPAGKLVTNTQPINQYWVPQRLYRPRNNNLLLQRQSKGGACYLMCVRLSV